MSFCTVKSTVNCNYLLRVNTQFSYCKQVLKLVFCAHPQNYVDDEEEEEDEEDDNDDDDSDSHDDDDDEEIDMDIEDQDSPTF